MKPVRILQIARMDNRAGIETFLINLFRNVDKSVVQMDFLRTNRRRGPFDEEILTYGGNIYYVPPISKNPIDIYRHFQGLRNFFKENLDISVVHIHGNTAISLLDCIVAYKAGVNHIIGHSHNDDVGTLRMKCEHKLLKRLISPYLTERFACSEKAWLWMFKNNISKGDIVVIKNGIDTCLYQYKQQVANSVRLSLGISNEEIVFGSVGRLTKQKNYKLLIEAFAKMTKQRPKAKLILVGDGELRIELENRCNQLDIRDKIIFTGFVSNVKDYLQAIDIFVLTSLWEGLGICLIEAQTAGLPCVVSKAIVPEAIVIPELVTVVSDKANSTEWAEVLLRSNKDLNRKSRAKEVAIAGFDFINTTKNLENFYVSCRVGAEK